MTLIVQIIRFNFHQELLPTYTVTVLLIKFYHSQSLIIL